MSMPTLAKLRDLAKLYQRPISTFFLPEPPRDFDTLRDFRRLPDADARRMSPALRKVHRRAAEQQEIAAELLEEDGGLGAIDVIDVGSATLETSTEEAGRELRTRLGISVQQQHSWTDPTVAFTAWMEAADSLGVMVLRTSEVDSDEMRGFSLTGEVPVVVVNALDWPRGQVFTLVHELAHLMLREGGICNLLDDPQHHPAVEQWCNAVAAVTLMPGDLFRRDLDVSDGLPHSDWSDGLIEWVSARWSVSKEAVARRLITLGCAPPAFYDAKRAEYTAAYAAARDEERRRRRDRNSRGGPRPPVMAARDRGKPYVRLVLGALHSNDLSASSASTLLGLKVKHLPALEQVVRL